MKPYYQDNHVTIYHGCALDVLRTMDDCSVDSVVTDPPYGLSFMGKKWDYDVPSVDIWRECLRVLKPGGHLLSFAGTRTQHRMAVAIEDAGFEIRDMIAWVYGSGFPKSLDVSKAIDKAAGAERKVIEKRRRKLGGGTCYAQDEWTKNARQNGFDVSITAPATEPAKQWQGWGTALKPALEPITVARKPLIGTVAANVLKHGTGGLNIDGCRVGKETRFNASCGNSAGNTIFTEKKGCFGGNTNQDRAYTGQTVQGRWPANFTHDGSDEVVGLFPQAGGSKPIQRAEGFQRFNGTDYAGGKTYNTPAYESPGYNDSGSAARFFYCAKASKRDRDEGLPKGTTSSHPTVKATLLMRWLCRLVTPPQGIVLDPFMGSGSTGKGARCEGFRFIGIEREEEYCEIAKARTSKKRIEQEVLAL